LLSSTAGANQGYTYAGEQVELLFSESVEYLMWQVEGLRGLIRGREELASSILRLQRKIQTLNNVSPRRMEAGGRWGACVVVARG
jgi:hypothetical protein